MGGKGGGGEGGGRDGSVGYRAGAGDRGCSVGQGLSQPVESRPFGLAARRRFSKPCDMPRAASYGGGFAGEREGNARWLSRAGSASHSMRLTSFEAVRGTPPAGGRLPKISLRGRGFNRQNTR